MFKITQGKGVNVKFANGYAISVQWGPRNYCDNYYSNDFKDMLKVGVAGSADAEIAVFRPDGSWYWEHQVEGYCTPDRVAEVIAEIVALP